jgi:hypothetical protein
MPTHVFVQFARVIEMRTGRKFRELICPDINLHEYLDGQDPVSAAEAFLVDEGYANYTPDYLIYVMAEALS